MPHNMAKTYPCHHNAYPENRPHNRFAVAVVEVDLAVPVADSMLKNHLLLCHKTFRGWSHSQRRARAYRSPNYSRGCRQ